MKVPQRTLQNRSLGPVFQRTLQNEYSKNTNNANIIKATTTISKNNINTAPGNFDVELSNSLKGGPSHQDRPKKIRPQDDFDAFVNGVWESKTSIPSSQSSWGPWIELNLKVHDQIKKILEDLEAGFATVNNEDHEGRKVKLTHAEKLLRIFWLSGKALNEDLMSADLSDSDEDLRDSGNNKDKDNDRMDVDDNPYRKCRNSLINLLNSVTSEKSLGTLCGELLKYDIGPINFAPTQDQDHGINEIPNLFVNIVSDGLTLEDPSYYLGNEPYMKELRRGFIYMVKHTNDWLSLDPENELELDGFGLGKAILGLEMRLAAALPPPEVLRQNDKTYNKVKVSDLKKSYNGSSSNSNNISNGWSWTDWLNSSRFSEQLSDNDYVIVESESYLKKVTELAGLVHPGVWRAYLRFAIARKFGNLLRPKLFHEVLTALITGQQDMSSEYEQMLNYLNDVLASVLGSLYAKKHFSSEQKRGVLEIIQNLKKAFKKRILKLDWMDLETKDQAIYKLEKLRPLVGYPDDVPEYRDVSLGQLDPQNIIQNYLFLLEYNYDEWRRSIGKPQIPGTWHMPPHIINAYCDFESNEIVFPAAILQTPFYDPKALLSHNYGSIGAIIGHEITHAFDDEGSRFDSFGRTFDWWTERDRKEFEKRTEKIVQQFNGIKMAGVSVNGEMTQGENIADLGGLLTAYDAMMHCLKYPDASSDGSDGSKGSGGNSGGPNGCSDPKPNGDYDGAKNNYIYEKQQFFVSWALTWREMMTEEALRDIILTDCHAPHKLRINMPLSNMVEFYEAFYAKKGDKLYREFKDRVHIW